MSTPIDVSLFASPVDRETEGYLKAYTLQNMCVLQGLKSHQTLKTDRIFLRAIKNKKRKSGFSTEVECAIKRTFIDMTAFILQSPVTKEFFEGSRETNWTEMDRRYGTYQDYHTFKANFLSILRRGKK